MRCHRCSGNMVYQKFYGPHEHFWGWKCVFCGEIVDPVILENRSLSRGDRSFQALARKRS